MGLESQRGGAFGIGAIIAILFLGTGPVATLSAGLTDDVDPFIGTGGHGHTFPGATLPFGMVQLSPDTRLEGWDGCSGYHYSDTVVYGFSHTHLSGTGVSEYGDILFMPITGDLLFDNGFGATPDEGYASRFDKATEEAAPGWYTVRLTDYGIDVQLTATERTGLHRYVYPADRPGHLIIDLEHRDRVIGSSLRVISDHEVEGHRRSDAWARDQVVYFVARFSRPISAVTFSPDSDHDDDSATGTEVKAALSFGDAGGEVLVKVGISAVDVDGARHNLDSELPGWDFEATRKIANTAWNDALSVIEIEGGTAEQRTVFYTALYHSMLAPNVFSDTDGRYRGMDRQIHQAQDRQHYTVFSLWDTFRATHPLFTIIEPTRTAEFVNTFLAQYEQGGRLPVWELAGNETDCMIGYHSVSVIADAYVKGIRAFDADLALEAMTHSATTDLFGLDAYQKQGFIASDDESESVSKTLEYAYDDWCIARMAEAMDRDDVAREYDLRSQAWRHLLDPETGFMRPRLNQRWIDDFDPRRVDFNYTEANAWQYSFFVPHDVESLIDELGGDEAFAGRLDALFSADEQTTGRTQADITGLIGQYAHGNEPSHHVAWLYHFAGQPEKGQLRVREILDTLYSNAPDGLSGNEDCGQMSSWYVLSAIGLYPVNPGSPDYVIGAPLFPKVTIKLENDRSFVIRSDGDDGSAVVRSARLNDRPISRSFLRHEEIAAGGVLELELGDSSDSEWGHNAADRPRSRVAGDKVVPAPYAVADTDTFRDQLTVDLETAAPQAQIRYTIGEQPFPEDGALWSEPICRRAHHHRALPCRGRRTLQPDRQLHLPQNPTTMVDRGLVRAQQPVHSRRARRPRRRHSRPRRLAPRRLAGLSGHRLRSRDRSRRGATNLTSGRQLHAGRTLVDLDADRGRRLDLRRRPRVPRSRARRQPGSG